MTRRAAMTNPTRAALRPLVGRQVRIYRRGPGFEGWHDGVLERVGGAHDTDFWITLRTPGRQAADILDMAYFRRTDPTGVVTVTEAP